MIVSCAPAFPFRAPVLGDINPSDWKGKFKLFIFFVSLIKKLIKV